MRPDQETFFYFQILFVLLLFTQYIPYAPNLLNDLFFPETVAPNQEQWSKGQGLIDKSGKEIEVTLIFFTSFLHVNTVYIHR
jgi:hypothetical protein